MHDCSWKFQSSFSAIDRPSQQKIIKPTEDLNTANGTEFAYF